MEEGEAGSEIGAGEGLKIVDVAGGPVKDPRVDVAEEGEVATIRCTSLCWRGPAGCKHRLRCSLGITPTARQQKKSTMADVQLLSPTRRVYSRATYTQCHIVGLHYVYVV